MHQRGKPARAATDRGFTGLISEVLNEECQRPQINGAVVAK
jgi:hypothetical protein